MVARCPRRRASARTGAGGRHRGKEGGEGHIYKSLDWWDSAVELAVNTQLIGGIFGYLLSRVGLPSSWAVGRLGHAPAWAALWSAGARGREDIVGRASVSWAVS